MFLIKGIYRCVWVTRWSIKNTTWQNISLSLSLSQKSESWPAFSLAFTSVSGIYIWRDSIFDDFNIYISVKKASMLSSLIFTINKLIVNAVCSCIILKGLSSWCNRGHCICIYKIDGYSSYNCKSMCLDKISVMQIKCMSQTKEDWCQRVMVYFYWKQKGENVHVSDTFQ